jgi:hypothetical protein
MKKLLPSVIASLAILIGGFGLVYAFGTFNAVQQGFRQAGAAQAVHLTMQVEAGLADPNSDLIPDTSSCIPSCPGGALSFAITNQSDLPIRVTQLAQATFTCGSSQCPLINSNKNTDGSFVTHNADGSQTAVGSCAVSAAFVAPPNFDNWPTIAPHSTLQVNGTDNSQLGAGLIHLFSTTPQGCQGALFTIQLKVTATEAVAAPGPPVQP